MENSISFVATLYNRMYDKAKKTGEKQLLNRVYKNKNTLMSEYAMPNGSCQIELKHLL